MAKVQLCNVVVVASQTPFLSPFQFEITFECIEELKEDLEWKMIYVGSAESEEFDQVLDAVYVGPVPEGKHMFLFEADPPNIRRIPENDAIGVTVVLITCSYKDQEFIRVGYFINNEYTDPELNENLPSPPQFDKVTRNILSSEPRVTRFKINWDDTLPDTEMTEAQSSSGLEVPTTAAASASASSLSTTNTFGQSFHSNGIDGHQPQQQQQQQQQQDDNIDAANVANSANSSFHQNGSSVVYQPDNSNSLTAMECS